MPAPLLTKYQLLSRLFEQASGNYQASSNYPSLSQYWEDSQARPHRGILQSVQREDGSGSSFNITISSTEFSGDLQGPQTETFHIRTCD